MVKKEKEVKEISEDLLMHEEKILYRKNDLVVTNKRIIKHGTDFFSKLKHIFFEEYQDILLKDVLSIRINQHINGIFFKLGFIICLAIIPLSFFSNIDQFADYISIKLYSWILIISMICFASSYIFKFKVMNVIGQGIRMNFFDYDPEELLIIREIQKKNN